jgi:adenylate cyclase
LQFKSFRTRLIVFLAGLLLLVQAAVFFLVNAANISNAKLQINNDLEVGVKIFQRIINERTFSLLTSARSMSGDFAFKRTIADGDHGTILSVMANHLSRIDADAMMLVSMDGKLMANTLDQLAQDASNPWPRLIEAAEQDEYGETAGIVVVSDQLYQMTVVPLLSPEPVAWILIGFEINNRFAQDISKISQVSILHRKDEDAWISSASTLPPPLQDEIPVRLMSMDWQANTSIIMELGDTVYVSLVTQLDRRSDGEIVAVLQRSLQRQLAPYQYLRNYLIMLFAVGLTLSVFAAVMLARSVTRPVLDLSDGVKHIADGDYSRRVSVDHKDEIGALALSFNRMSVGLEEKERVRDLLGKVVSPAIAEELLSKDIELGGEERIVSILFSDVRNFTSLSENRSPGEVLSLLNRYLTRVSAVIERHGGVVDKYIGDAVMALFGAPLKHDNDAARAISTALGMVHALEALNAEFRENNMTELGVGVGINTAGVVVGNMGSTSRMNYTVIGDGVNLASRLEGLTRQYNVPIIVSEATRLAAPDFCYRYVDRVRVKGKQEPVSIYEPLGNNMEISDSLRQELDFYDEAQHKYRCADWPGAQSMFKKLAQQYPETELYMIYDERCSQYIQTPPPDPWDGVFSFEEK